MKRKRPLQLSPAGNPGANFVDLALCVDPGFGACPSPEGSSRRWRPVSPAHRFKTHFDSCRLGRPGAEVIAETL